MRIEHHLIEVDTGAGIVLLDGGSLKTNYIFHLLRLSRFQIEANKYTSPSSPAGGQAWTPDRRLAGLNHQEKSMVH